MADANNSLRNNLSKSNILVTNKRIIHFREQKRNIKELWDFNRKAKVRDFDKRFVPFRKGIIIECKNSNTHEFKEFSTGKIFLDDREELKNKIVANKI